MTGGNMSSGQTLAAFISQKVKDHDARVTSANDLLKSGKLASSEVVQEALMAAMKAEGSSYIFRYASMLIEDGCSPAILLLEITKVLAQGADDKASGRSGDSRRAYFDGKCEAVTSLCRHLSTHCSIYFPEEEN